MSTLKLLLTFWTELFQHILDPEVFRKDQDRCAMDRLDLEQCERSLLDATQFLSKSRPLQVQRARLFPPHQKEQASRNLKAFAITAIRLVSAHSINNVREPHFIHNEIIDAGRYDSHLVLAFPSACQLDADFLARRINVDGVNSRLNQRVPAAHILLLRPRRIITPRMLPNPVLPFMDMGRS
ncbi:MULTISPECIES: hypothetical protein [unclassified Variovorax]|uniref:hypothetical protein n=1 Tax=unclassified Variovorax TaxID=663243 RepID=UPI000AD45A27|nr:MULTISPECIES: hypothetical protein [unclassified Variovorax]